MAKELCDVVITLELDPDKEDVGEVMRDALDGMRFRLLPVRQYVQKMYKEYNAEQKSAKTRELQRKVMLAKRISDAIGTDLGVMVCADYAVEVDAAGAADAGDVNVVDVVRAAAAEEESAKARHAREFELAQAQREVENVEIRRALGFDRDADEVDEMSASAIREQWAAATGKDDWEEDTDSLSGWPDDPTVIEELGILSAATEGRDGGDGVDSGDADDSDAYEARTMRYRDRKYPRTVAIVDHFDGKRIFYRIVGSELGILSALPELFEEWYEPIPPPRVPGAAPATRRQSSAAARLRTADPRFPATIGKTFHRHRSSGMFVELSRRDKQYTRFKPVGGEHEHAIPNATFDEDYEAIVIPVVGEVASMRTVREENGKLSDETIQSIFDSEYDIPRLRKNKTDTVEVTRVTRLLPATAQGLNAAAGNGTVGATNLTLCKPGNWWKNVTIDTPSFGKLCQVLDRRMGVVGFKYEDDRPVDPMRWNPVDQFLLRFDPASAPAPLPLRKREAMTALELDLEFAAIAAEVEDDLIDVARAIRDVPVPNWP